MKATFADFLADNTNCSGFSANPDAIAIFDFLNQDENIIKMIESADRGRPALAGCLIELMEFYNGLNAPTIDFEDGFTRTVVGRMAKAVLKPFGYLPTVQRPLPKEFSETPFSSASCYKPSGPATMRIVKRVESI